MRSYPNKDQNKSIPPRPQSKKPSLSDPKAISPLSGVQRPASPLNRRQATSPLSAGSKGRQLPEAIREQMEYAFDSDFSTVRITENSQEAEMLGVKAFARGEEIHLAPGNPLSGTQADLELLAHELAHIVQQRQGKVTPNRTLPTGQEANDSPMLEQEAVAWGKIASNGERVLNAPAVRPGIKPVIQMQGDPEWASISGFPIGSIQEGLSLTVDADGDQFRELQLRFSLTDHNHVIRLEVSTTEDWITAQPVTMEMPVHGLASTFKLEKQILKVHPYSYFLKFTTFDHDKNQLSKNHLTIATPDVNLHPGSAGQLDEQLKPAPEEYTYRFLTLKDNAIGTFKTNAFERKRIIQNQGKEKWQENINYEEGGSGVWDLKFAPDRIDEKFHIRLFPGSDKGKPNHAKVHVYYDGPDLTQMSGKIKSNNAQTIQLEDVYLNIPYAAIKPEIIRVSYRAVYISLNENTRDKTDLVLAYRYDHTFNFNEVANLENMDEATNNHYAQYANLDKYRKVYLSAYFYDGKGKKKAQIGNSFLIVNEEVQFKTFNRTEDIFQRDATLEANEILQNIPESQNAPEIVRRLESQLFTTLQIAYQRKLISNELFSRYMTFRILLYAQYPRIMAEREAQRIGKKNVENPVSDEHIIELSFAAHELVKAFFREVGHLFILQDFPDPTDKVSDDLPEETIKYSSDSLPFFMDEQSLYYWDLKNDPAVGWKTRFFYHNSNQPGSTRVAKPITPFDHLKDPKGGSNKYTELEYLYLSMHINFRDWNGAMETWDNMVESMAMYATDIYFYKEEFNEWNKAIDELNNEEETEPNRPELPENAFDLKGAVGEGRNTLGLFRRVRQFLNKGDQQERTAKRSMKAIRAMFYPEHGNLGKSKESEMVKIPVPLYYYIYKGEMHLVSFLTPEPTVLKEKAQGRKTPTDALFQLLNNKKHIPKGWLYYRVEGRADVVECTAPTTFHDYLNWIATVAAMIGLAAITVATAGTAAGVTLPMAGAIAGTSFTIATVAGGMGAYLNRQEDQSLGREGTWMDAFAIGSAVITAFKLGRVLFSFLGGVNRAGALTQYIFIPLEVADLGIDITVGLIGLGQAVSIINNFWEWEYETTSEGVVAFGQLVLMLLQTGLVAFGTVPRLKAINNRMVSTAQLGNKVMAEIDDPLPIFRYLKDRAWNKAVAKSGTGPTQYRKLPVVGKTEAVPQLPGFSKTEMDELYKTLTVTERRKLTKLINQNPEEIALLYRRFPSPFTGQVLIKYKGDIGETALHLKLYAKKSYIKEDVNGAEQFKKDLQTVSEFDKNKTGLDVKYAQKEQARKGEEKTEKGVLGDIETKEETLRTEDTELSKLEKQNKHRETTHKENIKEKITTLKNEVNEEVRANKETLDTKTLRHEDIAGQTEAMKDDRKLFKILIEESKADGRMVKETLKELKPEFEKAIVIAGTKPKLKNSQRAYEKAKAAFETSTRSATELENNLWKIKKETQLKEVHTNRLKELASMNTDAPIRQEKLSTILKAIQGGKDLNPAELKSLKEMGLTPAQLITLAQKHLPGVSPSKISESQLQELLMAQIRSNDAVLKNLKQAFKEGKNTLYEVRHIQRNTLTEMEAFYVREIEAIKMAIKDTKNNSHPGSKRLRQLENKLKNREEKLELIQREKGPLDKIIKEYEINFTQVKETIPNQINQLLAIDRIKAVQIKTFEGEIKTLSIEISGLNTKIKDLESRNPTKEVLQDKAIKTESDEIRTKKRELKGEREKLEQNKEKLTEEKQQQEEVVSKIEGQKKELEQAHNEELEKLTAAKNEAQQRLDDLKNKKTQAILKRQSDLDQNIQAVTKEMKTAVGFLKLSMSFFSTTYFKLMGQQKAINPGDLQRFSKPATATGKNLKRLGKVVYFFYSWIFDPKESGKPFEGMDALLSETGLDYSTMDEVIQIINYNFPDIPEVAITYAELRKLLLEIKSGSEEDKELAQEINQFLHEFDKLIYLKQLGYIPNGIEQGTDLEKGE